MNKFEKDGFELRGGDYYWACWTIDNKYKIPYYFIVEYSGNSIGKFSMCGDDVVIHDYEIALLRKVEPYVH